MAMRFVRAAYEFPTNEPGEISLAPGEIVLVTGQVNADWLSGNVRGQSGNFPANFVEDLNIPDVLPGQKLFEATETFPAQVSGDLGFRKGDFIVGTQQIDGNWWRGARGSDAGIFPVTHVKEIPLESYQEQNNATQSGQTQNTHQTASHSAAPSGNEWKIRVRAKNDLVAQIDDELSFNAGDEIIIRKAVNADFYIGECNGRTGSFPIFWVDIIDADQFQKLKETVSGQHTSLKSFKRTASYKEADAPPQPAPSAISNYDDFRERTASFTRNNTRSYDTVVEAYGRTRYPFVGQNHNELTFLDNEIVTLKRHIDNQWTEGELDGRVGLFPTEYVEIIVDCPFDDTLPEENEAPNSEPGRSDYGAVSNLPRYSSENSAEPRYDYTAEQTCDTTQDSQTSNDISVNEGTETYALVMYDYDCRNPGELTIRHGETVTILKTLDEHWYEVRDDNGEVGFCPINYVELIGAEPEIASPTVSVCVDNTITNSTTDEPVPPVKAQTQSPTFDSSTAEKPPESPMPEKVKPPLSPKPALKPKPELKPKPVNLNQMHLNHKPQNLASSFPKQKRPTSYHSQVSLDDMIKSEMSLAKREAECKSLSSSSLSSLGSDPEQRPRASSALSQGTTNAMNPEITGTTVWYSDIPPVPIERGGPNYSSLPLPKTSTNRKLEKQTGFDLDANSQRKTAPPRPMGPRPPPAPPKQPLIPVPTQLGRSQFHTAKPVPQRAAPLPPTHRGSSAKPSRPLPPRAGAGSLIQPDTSMTDIGDNENSDIARDLVNRITETEQDLQNYRKCKKDIEQRLHQPGGEEDMKELNDSLEFYIANISGLTAELTALKKSLNQLQSKNGCLPQVVPKERHRLSQEVELKRQMEEMKVKMKDKRERIIEELIGTEKNYMRDIRLCHQAFLAPGAEKCSAVDMDTLFCNIEEILDISRHLLKDLEAATSGKDFDQQTIGQSFVEFASKMTSAYAPYCRNHDDVMALLEKYEDNPEIQEFINRGLAVIRRETTVFDLGSLLIKPVQRILKYPLLLNELFKSTDDSHPDKQPVLKAINAMTDVATAINEYKRRKDLVYKYRQDSDTSFGEKIAKLNLHSIKKKSTRIGARLSSNLGIATLTVDENFNREENKFKCIDRAIRLFIKNVTTYMEQMKDTTMFLETVSTDVAEYYMENNNQPEVHQYQEACNIIGVDLMDKFREDVDTRVLEPLNKLMVMFQGPTKVIKKRLDKLIDYDHMTGSVKRAKDQEQVKQAKEDQEVAKRNYMALNAQLLDELPKLYTLSLEVFQEAIRRFVSAQQKFTHGTLSQMQKLLRLPLFAASNENIIEQFNIRHTEAIDRLSDLTFLPKNFNPRQELKAEAKKGRRSSGGDHIKGASEAAGVQSDSQRAMLRSKYHQSGKLYTVTSAYQPMQMMDIALNEGDLVGVVKDQDPMGSKERWFVDTGVAKGFVPKKFLHQVTMSTSSEPSGGLPKQASFMTEMDTLFDPPSYNEAIESPPSYNDSTSCGRLSLNSSHNSSFEGDGRTSTGYGSFVAAYTFAARNENEMSIQEDQVLTVLQKHDVEGNTEWWLVSSQSGQGYVPASYLKPNS